MSWDDWIARKRPEIYEENFEILKDLLGEGGYERGFWPTPYAGVPALMQHLPKVFTYCEPCVGRGDLIKHMSHFRKGAILTQAYDTHPLIDDVRLLDTRYLTADDTTSPIHGEADFIITNPPWIKEMMEPMLLRWPQLKPTWVLVNATFLHTLWGARIMPYCHKIVSIGRIQWIPGSKGTGLVDACWLLLDKPRGKQPDFYPYIHVRHLKTDAEVHAANVLRRRKERERQKRELERQARQRERAHREAIKASLLRRRQFVGGKLVYIEEIKNPLHHTEISL